MNKEKTMKRSVAWIPLGGLIAGLLLGVSVLPGVYGVMKKIDSPER